MQITLTHNGALGGYWGLNRPALHVFLTSNKFALSDV